MTQPLLGLRVLDLGTGTAGPRAAGILADYGADVIRVEPPGGDRWRLHLAREYSVFNRQKRSVVIDMGDPVGRRELEVLLGGADVVITSWSDGVAERHGLDAATLRARHPGLIVATVRGMGGVTQARLRGYESLVHAVVGTTGEQVGHRPPPVYEGLPFASIGAANLAVIGILAALYRRALDGHGRAVTTSLADGALAFLSMLWGDNDLDEPPRVPGRARLVASTYRCADDEYLGVHTGAVGAFGRLMDVLGLADRIASRPDGLDMGVPLEPHQVPILATELPALFATRPRQAWLTDLLAADVCAVPLLRPGQVFDEPQVRHNSMVTVVDDPVLGLVEQVAPAIRFDAQVPPARRPAPRPGEHDGARWQHEPWTCPHPDAAGIPAPVLDGVRVVDLGAYFAGPYAARLLADLGADVVKVEPPAGDQMRGIVKVFRAAQAGKRSLAADFKAAALAPVRDELVRWADVVIHNMRPGAAERLGFGRDQIVTVAPSTIYVHLPGWGSDGPDCQRQSFAPLLSGYAGIGFEVAGQFNPPLFPAGNEDPGNGLLGAIGALCALVHRQRTGAAVAVECPQLNTAMTHLAHLVRRVDDGEVLGAMALDPMQYGLAPTDRLYETADGWLLVAAHSDPELTALTGVTGTDPADADALAERFWTRSTAQWLDDLSAAGVSAVAPASSNQARAFLRDDRHVASGRSGVAAHAEEGHVRGVGRLVQMSDAAPVDYRIAPGLGEHTDEVLEMLGIEGRQIAQWRLDGIVR